MINVQSWRNVRLAGYKLFKLFNIKWEYVIMLCRHVVQIRGHMDWVRLAIRRGMKRRIDTGQFFTDRMHGYIQFHTSSENQSRPL
jgi:hypothetical protein